MHIDYTYIRNIFSCEATLDNTQNVPPSVHIQVKEFDASSPPRDLKFSTELKTLHEAYFTIIKATYHPQEGWDTHQPRDGHQPTLGWSPK